MASVATVLPVRRSSVFDEPTSDNMQNMRADNQTPTHTDVTSIDPLNLALTAKSTPSRFVWWFMTVGLTVGMIAVIATLVDTYQKRDTRFVIQVMTKLVISSVRWLYMQMIFVIAQP